MRVITTGGNALYFLHGDHLGSTSLTTNSSGGVIARQLYDAWGNVRLRGDVKTDIGYTSQREDRSTNLMFYRARYYSPYLNRWLSPDTIVPDPANPQSLNRYSYVNNRPLNFTDPTGHFEDDALRAYLKRTYGDKWEDYWKSWAADDDWMSLLHAAQAGDVLSKIDGSNGSDIQHFQFLGHEQDVLTGIVKAVGPGQSSEWKGEWGSLNDIFSNRGRGVGVLRFAANGDVGVVGTIGNVSFSVHKVTEEDVDARNTGLALAAWGIGAPAHWVVGLILAFAEGRFNRQISTLPGMTVGDNELTVSGFTPSGPPESAYGHTITPGVYWGWEYTFRGGVEQTLSSGYYSHPVYNPHRWY
jgi:RHS repeat-associated protein